MNSIAVHRNSPSKHGYFLAALASFTYGLNPLFAVPLYGMGFNVMSVLFYRYLVAAILLAVIMLMGKKSFKVSKNALMPLLFAGILFALSSLTLFESYKCMDVGIASTILYVTPFFVAILMTVFFKEKIPAIGIICIGVAFLGIGMLSIKADSTIQNPLGIGLVILSALVYAIYMILIDNSSLNRIETVPLTFYCLVVGIVMFGILLESGDGISPLPLTFSAIFNVVGLAVFPTIISIVAMTVAIHLIGPVPTSILEALEPVTALFVGFIMFGERLTLLNILGVIVVLSSVTYFVLYRHKQKI